MSGLRFFFSTTAPLSASSRSAQLALAANWVGLSAGALGSSASSDAAPRGFVIPRLVTGVGGPLLGLKLAGLVLGGGSSAVSRPDVALLRPKRRPPQLAQDALFRTFVHKLLSALIGPQSTVLVLRNTGALLTLAELVFVWQTAWRIFQQFPLYSSSHLARAKYKWRHGALALFSSVLIKDPHLLVSWLSYRLPHIPLQQHRRFFRLLFTLMRAAATHPTYRFALAGVYFYLVGKISVTGNSMSRSMLVTAGRTSASCLNLQHAEAFTLVRTQTGCLGLTIRYVF